MENIFEDIIGQEYSISILQSALKKNKISPAYIFSGPEGVGRKKTALRFSEAIINNNLASLDTRRKIENSNHPDFLLIEPTYLYKGQLINKSKAEDEHIIYKTQPQIRLEQIRSLKRFLSRTPIESTLSIIIIEDIERINEAAANALLKTLEEPNKGILILICERQELLLDTIRSRCQIIPFNPLKETFIKHILSQVDTNIYSENSQEIKEQEILNLANGSPGAFLKHLKYKEEIPEHLWALLQNLPEDCLSALSLARNLTEELSNEQQVWIITWLQQNIWLKDYNPKTIQRLDKLRYQLINYVQPRLAWEVALLEINRIKQ